MMEIHDDLWTLPALRLAPRSAIAPLVLARQLGTASNPPSAYGPHTQSYTSLSASGKSADGSASSNGNLVLRKRGPWDPTPQSIESTEVVLHADGPRGPDESVTVKVTVGAPLPGGKGNNGAVHDVTSCSLAHPAAHDLVIKMFTRSEMQFDQELENLRKVDQLHASGKYRGHNWVVVDKIRGQHLEDTQAYKKAETEGNPRFKKLKEHASKLVGEAQVECATKYKVLQGDLNSGNVLFEVNADGELSKANLIDWGLVVPAPKPGGTNGEYTEQQKHGIMYGGMGLAPIRWH